MNELGFGVSKMFSAGTLVMTIAANIGDVALLDFDACFPDSIVGFIPRSGGERDYLYYVFRAMKPELLREAPVNTKGNLNVDRIGSMRIALPPRSEQPIMVEKIEEGTRGVTVTIDSARKEISLLREYRTRVLTDAVTGKLDVREATARLPEVARESETPDTADEFTATDEEVEGGLQD